MKSRIRTVLMALGLVAAVAQSSYAHHAMSLFDNKKVVTTVGTVTEVNWSNPHATLFLDSTDAQGNVEKWTIEFGPPAQLKRDNGMASDTFKPGDKITLDGFAYKDGRKIMRPKRVVLANGKEVSNLY